MSKKVSDALFSARWGIANKKYDYATEKVTEALVLLGALPSSTPAEEPDRPDITPPTTGKKFWEPKFKVVKGVKYKEHGKYKTPSGKYKGMTLHYTVSDSTPEAAQGVVRYLAKNGLGCMVMDKFGTIWIPEDFDVLRDVAYHAGTSSWKGKSGMSSYQCGMEVCNWGKLTATSKARVLKNGGKIRVVKASANMKAGEYEAYTEDQEREIHNFITWSKAVNEEFDVEWVAGHDEVAPTRKSDPGGSLSMTMPALRKMHA